jgi:tetratricopeptide (TPR) repeat protein
MKIEELKAQARRHELREEWQKAFDLYSAALRIHDEEEPPDITLLNRVGDIQTRLGQISGAIDHYEKAITLYLEAELPNSAIAICKKVLRNLPERNIFFLRMGQIRAAQGFLTDARQNFLTYAERQTALGDVESALNALIEFVDLSPEDMEIRRGLASQLESHGRTEAAIEQYTEAYRRLIMMGEDEEAKTVSEKLEELAPDLVLPDPESVREEIAAPDTEALVLESTSLGGHELKEWEEDDDGSAFEGIEAELADTYVGEEDDDEDEAESAGVTVVADPEFADDLPTFDFGLEDGPGDTEVLPNLEFDEVEAGELEAEGESLPLLSFEEDEEEEPVDELPVEAALEDAAFEAGREGPEETGAVDVEVEAKLVESITTTPPGDHKEAADRGDMDLAIERVKLLIEVDPDAVELYQRLVEYAFRKNDQEVLVSAYLELAGCLGRTGAPMKAKAVYQQVLSLAPEHEGATAGIQGLEGAAGAEPPTQVASSEEYVDLGSMILGDEAERSTRWKVAAEAPSGDDEADFAKMLGQFKEKVSEHLAVDDVAAHHDLGTAYMEMGLFDEAIAEFQMALRASPSHLPTHEVTGRCWMEMGKPDMAARALYRALTVAYEVEDEMIGIYYLMGRAQEDQGNSTEALEFFERVFSLDINFEDVTERLRALR